MGPKNSAHCSDFKANQISSFATKKRPKKRFPWRQTVTFLSSRFCSASFPLLSLISTFLGLEMSVCRSMTRPSLRPLHADSASKSSVLLSEEPSTGQNTPQNFCLGLAGLSEPMFLKKAGTSPVVDMPCLGGQWGEKRSSAPTSYCIGLCSRRLSERRWTHYSAKEKLTNAAKTVTLSSIG